MRFVVAAVGLGMFVTHAAPTVAQITYVEQVRRVEAIPDDDPPPTQTTGQTSQEASGFGPFNGSLNTTFYWGQEGYDYGGVARVSQNSELTFSGVYASGSLYAEGDTVSAGVRSILETTFDLASATDYGLVIGYRNDTGSFANSVGTDGVVELRRAEPGGDIVIVRREANFVADQSAFETVDAGTLQPGRYELSMLFQASDAATEPREWQYNARLVVPEPAGAMALTALPALLLRRRSG